MKLEDFVETQNYDLNNACLSKCYHVIGTCGDCKHWKWYGAMNPPPICKHPSKLVDVCGSGDGCIHWDKKE